MYDQSRSVLSHSSTLLRSHQHSLHPYSAFVFWFPTFSSRFSEITTLFADADFDENVSTSSRNTIHMLASAKVSITPIHLSSGPFQMMFSIIDNILANNNQEQWELLNEASDVATYVRTYVRSNEVEEDGSVEYSLMSSDRVAMYFRVLPPNLVETHT